MMPVGEWVASTNGGCAVCPYCGHASIDPVMTPAVPVHGAGPIVASEVSWESRCPRCGGGFAVGPKAPLRRAMPPETAARLREDLDALDALLDRVRGRTGYDKRQHGRE